MKFLDSAALASADCRSENVAIKAIIIAELELCNAKMQILFADVVESANVKTSIKYGTSPSQ